MSVTDLDGGNIASEAFPETPATGMSSGSAGLKKAKSGGFQSMGMKKTT